jgi:hypothetical protein
VVVGTSHQVGMFNAACPAAVQARRVFAHRVFVDTGAEAVNLAINLRPPALLGHVLTTVSMGVSDGGRCHVGRLTAIDVQRWKDGDACLKHRWRWQVLQPPMSLAFGFPHPRTDQVNHLGDVVLQLLRLIAMMSSRDPVL